MRASLSVAGSSVAVLIWGALVATEGVAGANDCPGPAPQSVIDLPAGFQPEGIAAGRGDALYVTNFNDGSVFAASGRTGAGAILVPAQAGRSGVGVAFDRRSRLLIVAGGATGQAYFHDSETGASAGEVTLATGTTFINDLALTRDAAYFTDSFQPVLYRLAIDHRGRPTGTAETLPLGGDYQFVPTNPDGSPAFNNNGIVESHGKLLVVNSVTGVLYQVDPDSGVASAIDLGGGSLVNGDGMVLRGRTLFVVQNFSNQISEVRLSAGLARGNIVRVITHPRFDVPATAALLGGALFVTNARFSTPHTETTPYWVVRVPISDRGD